MVKTSLEWIVNLIKIRQHNHLLSLFQAWLNYDIILAKYYKLNLQYMYEHVCVNYFAKKQSMANSWNCKRSANTTMKRYRLSSCFELNTIPTFMPRLQAVIWPHEGVLGVKSPTPQEERKIIVLSTLDF